MVSKPWKKPGTIVPAGRVTGCGTTARGLQIMLPVVPISTSDFSASLKAPGWTAVLNSHLVIAGT
jgi:hypothetical protein